MPSASSTLLLAAGLLSAVAGALGERGALAGLPGADGQQAEGGVVHSTLLASLSGRFDDVAATNTFPVGTVELVSEGCDRLRLRYRFDDDEVAGAFRALAGEIQLRRLGACPAV